MIKEKWARKFDRCVECGEKEKRHIANGRCVRCYARIYIKTESGRAAHNRWFVKYYKEHKEQLSATNKRNYEKRNPAILLKRELLDVIDLRHTREGKCRWEACNHNHPKIYASGLCRACYGRLLRTPNFERVKELYNPVKHP